MEQFIFSTLKQKQTLDYHHWDETDTLHLAQIEDLLLLLLLLQQFKLQYKTCFRNSKDSFDNFDFVELEEARRKLTVIVNLLTLNSYFFKCCCHKNLSIIIFRSKLLSQASWKLLEDGRVKLEKEELNWVKKWEREYLKVNSSAYWRPNSSWV